MCASWQKGELVLMFHTLAKCRRQGWVVIGSHRGLAPALHLGVLEDFLKEHGNLYTALEKSEQNRCHRNHLEARMSPNDATMN